jgi:hypothetical protein
MDRCRRRDGACIFNTQPEAGFFTAQFEFLADGGNSPSGQAEVRYETADNGTTWRIAQVNMGQVARP